MLLLSRGAISWYVNVAFPGHNLLCFVNSGLINKLDMLDLYEPELFVNGFI